MIWILDYKEDFGGDRYDALDISYEVEVHEDLDDVTDFMLLQNTNCTDLDERCSFIADIRQKWFDNKIDVFELYGHNKEFRKFLKTRYIDVMYDRISKRTDEYIDLYDTFEECVRIYND